MVTKIFAAYTLGVDEAWKSWARERLARYDAATQVTGHTYEGRVMELREGLSALPDIGDFYGDLGALERMLFRLGKKTRKPLI